MQRSFAGLHRKWAFMDLIIKMPAEIYEEHAALTKGTNIDISDLNYDILKEKRSVQWPYTKEINGSWHSKIVY